MSIDINKYIGRAVIRYLNGDMNLFYTYVNKAMKIYEQEKCIAKISELIDNNTKYRLYKMVS